MLGAEQLRIKILYMLNMAKYANIQVCQIKWDSIINVKLLHSSNILCIMPKLMFTMWTLPIHVKKGTWNIGRKQQYLQSLTLFIISIYIELLMSAKKIPAISWHNILLIYLISYILANMYSNMNEDYEVWGDMNIIKAASADRWPVRNLYLKLMLLAMQAMHTSHTFC